MSPKYHGDDSCVLMPPPHWRTGEDDESRCSCHKRYRRLMSLGPAGKQQRREAPTPGTVHLSERVGTSPTDTLLHCSLNCSCSSWAKLWIGDHGQRCCMYVSHACHVIHRVSPQFSAHRNHLSPNAVYQSLSVHCSPKPCVHDNYRRLSSIVLLAYRYRPWSLMVTTVIRPTTSTVRRLRGA
jgi:hypothetical protein